MLATATQTTTRGQHLLDLKQGDDRYLRKGDRRSSRGVCLVIPSSQDKGAECSIYLLEKPLNPITEQLVALALLGTAGKGVEIESILIQTTYVLLWIPCFSISCCYIPYQVTEKQTHRFRTDVRLSGVGTKTALLAQPHQLPLQLYGKEMI